MSEPISAEGLCRIDPEIGAFVDSINAGYAKLSPEGEMTIAERRAVAERVREPWRSGGPIMAETRDFELNGLRMRLHRPTSDGALAAMLYIHGGGWALFSVDTHDRLMREYAQRAGIAVIGIDYSLAPEAKFPVALNEIVAAIEGLRLQAAALGVDGERMAIGGDSAGANLAVVSTVTLVAYLALQHLARSPWGRVLKALREDERAAISLGKSARFYRVQAFAVGGALMGLAGAVQAHFIGFIAPDNYAPMLTFQVWVMLIVGGSGSNRGAVVGSVLVWAIWAGSGALVSWLAPPDQQARAAALQIAAIGIMLCVILLVRPGGLFGNLVERRRPAAKTSTEAGGPST